MIICIKKKYFVEHYQEMYSTCSIYMYPKQINTSINRYMTRIICRAVLPLVTICWYGWPFNSKYLSIRRPYYRTAKQFVVKPRFHICGWVYALCESDKKWKTCKHMSVIPYARLRMWFPNVTEQTTPTSDCCKCEWFELGHNILNSTFRFECPPGPRKTCHKVRGLSKSYATTMLHMVPQCRILMQHYA